MSNINNENKVKCEYYVPMGKPGALVIKAPVLLSNLKITIPVSKKLTLNKNCINIKTIFNKIFLKIPKINFNNELSINGYIHKSITYSDTTLKISSQCCINIPINATIVIDFDQMPIYKNDNSTSCFYGKSKSINCNFDYVKITKDSMSNINSDYCFELILSLKLTLTQIQNVFIPEPDGDFMLIYDNFKTPTCDNESVDDAYFLVGCDPTKGLIANNIHPPKI